MHQAVWIQWWTLQTHPLFLRRLNSCGRGQMINKWTEKISLRDLSHQPSLPSWYCRCSGEQGLLTVLEYARLSPASRPLSMFFPLAGKLCTQTSHGFFLHLVQDSAEMSLPKEAFLIFPCEIDLPHSTWLPVLFSLYLLPVEIMLFMCFPYFFFQSPPLECKYHVCFVHLYSHAFRTMLLEMSVYSHGQWWRVYSQKDWLSALWKLVSKDGLQWTTLLYSHPV